MASGENRIAGDHQGIPDHEVIIASAGSPARDGIDKSAAEIDNGAGASCFCDRRDIPTYRKQSGQKRGAADPHHGQ
jgi:hypothetical protein